MFKTYKNKKNLSSDLLASLGVFVVAIPLSVGIALASGTSPASGLIAAAVGGLIVGMLSGSPLLVSGPAAGLAAVVLGFVNEYGIQGLAAITFLAGMIQIFLGLGSTGRFFALVPDSILKGMLAAIGLIIAMSQIHVIFGYAPAKSFADGLLTLHTTIFNSVTNMHNAPVIICGLITFLVLYTFPKFKFLSRIPPVLPAVVFATIASLSFEMPRVNIEPIIQTGISSLGSFLAINSISSFYYYLTPAIVLALIASAETLLTAKAVDGLANTKSKLNKELFAQGVGNGICGIFGGIPVSGVIVRSAANVDFGAKTRVSTIAHGAWVLLFVILLPGLLMSIPLTALAAVLVMTGFKLFNVQQFISYFETQRSSAVLWLTTVLGILFLNLLNGLLLAITVALIMNLHSHSYNYRKFINSLQTSLFGKRSDA